MIMPLFFLLPSSRLASASSASSLDNFGDNYVENFGTTLRSISRRFSKALENLLARIILGPIWWKIVRSISWLMSRTIMDKILQENFGVNFRVNLGDNIAFNFGNNYEYNLGTVYFCV